MQEALIAAPISLLPYNSRPVITSSHNMPYFKQTSLNLPLSLVTLKVWALVFRHVQSWAIWLFLQSLPGTSRQYFGWYTWNAP